MGDVHEFKRRPKNQQQFRGYRPKPTNGGGGNPERRQLRGWQRSALAWLTLILVATGIWAVGYAFGGG